MSAVANSGGSFRVEVPSREASSAVVVTTSIAQTAWNQFVESHPEGTVEHLWEWQTVFSEVFGQEPVYLAALRGEAIVGVLPLVKFRSLLFGRSLVSVPYANYGGLVSSDGAATAALVARARDIGHEFGARHVELRNTKRKCRELIERQHKVGARLPLPATAEALWTDLDRKVRNQIRKAQKEGLTSAAGGSELLDEFYGVFSTNMRDLGTPVFPRELFTKVTALFGEHARVHLVRRAEQAVAAGIALSWRNSVLVPWASSLRAFRNLSPNMLLYWSMLEAAIADGSRVFDFGRSSRDSGTHHFKQQWQAQDIPLHWEYVLLRDQDLPDHGTTNPRMELFIRAWQRLPLPISRWLGPRIIKNIP